MIPPFKVVVCVLSFASYSNINDTLWYPIEIWDEYMKVLSFVRRSNITKLGPSVLFFYSIYTTDALLHSEMDRQRSSFCIFTGHSSAVCHFHLHSLVSGTFEEVSIQITVLFGTIIGYLLCYIFDIINCYL